MFPSVHNALLILSILLATVYVARTGVRNDPVAGFIYICSLGMLPGAIGRNDPGHVVFYSFGFFILAGKFLWEHQYRHRYFTKYCVFVGSWFFVSWLVSLTYFYSLPAGAMAAKTALTWLPKGYEDRLIDRIPGNLREKAIKFFKAPDKLDESQLRGDNLYVISPKSGFQELTRLRIPYFVTFHNASTRSAFEKINDDIGTNDVIVPFGFVDRFCQPWVVDHRAISLLFLFPTFVFEQKNQPETVSQDFCKRLQAMRVMYQGAPGGFQRLSSREKI